MSVFAESGKNCIGCMEVVPSAELIDALSEVNHEQTDMHVRITESGMSLIARIVILTYKRTSTYCEIITARKKTIDKERQNSGSNSAFTPFPETEY